MIHFVRVDGGFEARASFFSRNHIAHPTLIQFAESAFRAETSYYTGGKEGHPGGHHHLTTEFFPSSSFRRASPLRRLDEKILRVTVGPRLIAYRSTIKVSNRVRPFQLTGRLIAEEEAGSRWIPHRIGGRGGGRVSRRRGCRTFGKKRYLLHAELESASKIRHQSIFSCACGWMCVRARLCRILNDF